MNLGPYAVWIRAIGILAVIAGLIGLGWYLGSRSWETKYNQLQAQNWQGKATDASVALKAREKQLAEANLTNDNNAAVIRRYDEQVHGIESDRDRAQRLLDKASADNAAARARLSAAENRLAAPASCGTEGTERLAELCAAVASEAEYNDAALDALVDQLAPQVAPAK